VAKDGQSKASDITSAARVRACRERVKQQGLISKTPPLIHFAQLQIAKISSLTPIASHLSELLVESWSAKPEDFKHKVMDAVCTAIGIREYYDAIQKYPVKLSEELTELGPALRLQLLFKMTNEPGYKVTNNFYSLGCELFRNLSQFSDLTILDELSLGENGRACYAKLGHVAYEEKTNWQAYAAAVYLRVSQPWIQTLLNEEILPGALKKTLDASRRNVEDHGNLL